MTDRETDRLATTLAQRITGEVCVDQESLAASSRDFGGVVEASPQVVVWPADTNDVAAIIRTAQEMESSLAVRGAGHSQGGQSLSRGGILIETQRLNEIEPLSEDDDSITAGAGLLWSDLINVTIDRDLLPVVMTDHLKVTLGGTLAVGGVGPASFRHGAQIHHCSGVEVVLGTGEVRWVTAESEPQLFHHVLGGLGQFGVVTKVKLRLQSAPHMIRSRYLTYHNLETFLKDAQRLMMRETVHWMSGFAVPVESHTPGNCHHFVLVVCTHSDETPLRTNRQVVFDLTPEEQFHEDLTPREYLARLEDTFADYQRPTEKSRAHPWVEHFLPVDRVKEFVKAVTTEFPTDPLLLWPMQSTNLRHPMLCLPKADAVVLAGIMCSLQHSAFLDVLPRLKKFDALGTALGGKRYLSGWLDFDTDRWREHFGEKRWNEITALKRRCDPNHLFRMWDRVSHG